LQYSGDSIHNYNTKETSTIINQPKIFICQQGDCENCGHRDKQPYPNFDHRSKYCMFLFLFFYFFLIQFIDFFEQPCRRFSLLLNAGLNESAFNNKENINNRLRKPT